MSKSTRIAAILGLTLLAFCHAPGAYAGVRSLGTRPHAWCGWYMARQTGIHDRSLWIARNWARVGHAAHAAPGVIVVWAHHVGRVLAVSGRRILVHSGNDGNRVRDRWRDTHGVIAFRRL